MSKPTPGERYTAAVGDTLERIAAIAYGDVGRAADIAQSNQIASLIPGDVIIIPGDDQNVYFDGEGLALLVNGIKIDVESLRVSRSIDALADGWAATLAWSPGDDPEFDFMIRPSSYSPAKIFVNGTLSITGRLYRTMTTIARRQSITLEGWSFAADIIDSTLKPPYESSDVTLLQRAQEIAKHFNVNVMSDLVVDGVFDRVTARPTQRAGDHLLALAAQRGVLVSSLPSGDIRLFGVGGGQHVGEIKEGTAGFSGFSADFDGRKRFSAYRFVSKSPRAGAGSAVSIDPSVPVTRFTTFAGDDTDDPQAAADWRNRKAMADSLMLPIVADGFLSPSGVPWEPGQFVTLTSPSLFLPDGFEMLVRATEMVQSGRGNTTRLELVPPSAYAPLEVEVEDVKIETPQAKQAATAEKAAKFIYTPEFFGWGK